MQPEREVQGRLSAELRDGAPALFPLVNVKHVLQRERLEKKFVARVVVGGNRLRVRVDHERLEAVSFERERGVHAAVIELNALADPVRTAAENHYLALVRRLHFVVAAVVSRIIVGCVSLKFGGAGVHETIALNESECFSQRANFVLGFAGKISDLPVGKSERFGFGQQFGIEFGHQIKIKLSKVSLSILALASFVWKAYLISQTAPTRVAQRAATRHRCCRSAGRVEGAGGRCGRRGAKQ